MKKSFNSFLSQKGFTLTELLLVISIMALLVSIVLINLRVAREEADLARRTRDAATSNRLLVCGQGQMMDLDGNLYNTIDIDGLCWMRENLKFLPSVSPSSIGSDTVPMYYVYGYNGTNIEEAKAIPHFQTSGVLYNHTAARRACPPGTRLPTDAEWHHLERRFATDTCDPNRGDFSAFGCYLAGTRLKAAPPVWDGDNASGFSVVPSDLRGINGFPDGDVPSRMAWFWTSTLPCPVSQPWKRMLIGAWDEHYAKVFRGSFGPGLGLSVRCVQ